MISPVAVLATSVLRFSRYFFRAFSCCFKGELFRLQASDLSVIIFPLAGESLELSGGAQDLLTCSDQRENCLLTDLVKRDGEDFGDILDLDVRSLARSTLP